MVKFLAQRGELGAKSHRCLGHDGRIFEFFWKGLDLFPPILSGLKQ
jgi:hypothetical protein